LFYTGNRRTCQGLAELPSCVIIPRVIASSMTEHPSTSCTGTNCAFALGVTKDDKDEGRKTKDEGIGHSSLVIRHSSFILRLGSSGKTQLVAVSSISLV
jgi:hypothetical protein